MRKSNFSDDFKRDAVRQITERGYPVAEKCISEAPEVENAVERRVLAVLILIAAAAHEQKSDYASWLGRQLRVLFDRLPVGEPCFYALDFIRSVRAVDDLPLGALSQAEAVAQLGCG